MKKLILPLLLVSTAAWAQGSGIFSFPSLGNLLSFSSDDDELIKVEKFEYKRNTDASFCNRPIEMVDTIVFHHSETPSTTTPEAINRLHLNRGTKNDPWYMIAYSYVVNSPYAGETLPNLLVTEGRPLDIVGAHAGSKAYVPMDDEQQRLWAEGKVVCGKEGQDFKVDPAQIQNGKIKANVTSIGIVVNGNYSPFSGSNPNGYKRGKERGPTMETLTTLAKLSCQLQKKYPRMKYMRPHNSYHETSCPGDIWTIKDPDHPEIKTHFEIIQSIARGLGCEFRSAY